MAVEQTHWWHLRRAVETLRAGGVIAYPTEAVWGLGCDPWDEAAVANILALKQRPQQKGLILVAAHPEQVAYLLDPLPAELRQAALSHWPGPVTCLLPDIHRQVPEWLRGRHASIAVRVSAHPLVVALCEAFGGPLVSTSCNPAGRPAARSAIQVRQYFGEALDGILPGALGGQRQPSRIIDLVTNRVLR
ncbi:L-threonylcarbamoyladenylate synthase [Mangrovitalea sediminis]|uniref:L-threonylcarbamoyladenylate synthase n=1 Tax=Mangrovitalea sediminis TaxID=1982043 RepID=UPI000BE5F279|nr:Sua5/YciO/YrdC/YwlC family protein [Mangrovitalea sediminis]